MLRTLILSAGWVFLIGLFLTPTPFAQNLADDPSSALEAARTRAQELADPQSLDDQRWLESVNNRIEILEELIRTRNDQASLPDADSVSVEQAAAQAALDSLRALADPPIAVLVSPDDLKPFESQFATAESQRKTAGKAYSDLQNRATQVDDERKSLPARSSESQKRLDELTGDDPLTRYRRATEQLEIELIAERTTFVLDALVAWDTVLPVLRARRDAAELRYERARLQVTGVREQATALRGAEAERQREEAEAQARAAELAADPIESFRRRIRSEIASAQANATLTRTSITQIREQITTEKELLERVGDSKKRLETRLQLTGGGGSEGMLRQARQRLEENQSKLRGSVRPSVAEANGETQLQLGNVLDDIWELQTPDDVNERLLGLLKEVEPERADSANHVFGEVIRGKEGLLIALRDERDALKEAESAYSELLSIIGRRDQAISDLQTYIQTKLLWTRTASPVSPEAWSEMREELATLADHGLLDIVEEAEVRDRTRMLLAFGLLIGLCGVGMWWGRGWHDPIPVTKGSPGHRVAVWRKISKALVWAFAPSIALWLISGGITNLSVEGTEPPIAHLLSVIAGTLLFLRVAELVLKPRGLALHYSPGSEDAAASMLLAVRVIAMVAMLLSAPARVMSADPYGWERLPQLFEVLAMLTVGIVVGILLRHQGPVVRQWTQHGSFSRKLYRALGLLVPLGMLGLIVFDLFGYRAGAIFLFRNQVRTLFAVLILALLYRVAMRVGSRLSTAVSRRIIQHEGYAAASEASAKLERFLARTTALLIIAVAAIILREVFQIGGTGSEILHRVRLWDAGDGDWVTLLDVVDAFLLVIIGNLVSQALTKTYELVIAPLRGKDVAGRAYATLTMLRYLIMVIAIAAALLALKFSPSRLGWLLTAVSVGLGFGLQEIVANWVSGLILMIERPIRVGDVVTVGQTAGTVEEISMRATMVTNWDRQTIIVPNQKFITQEVTNWTRQDQIVRRTMPIGVAYGSDVEEVLRILDETVKAHDKVLANPGPRVWFNGFGDSSLNFDVWFYATFDDGLRARTELFIQVYAKLQEAGIQIPFPVRDVRMHVQHDGAPPSSKAVGVPEKEPPPQAPEPKAPATAKAPDPPTEPAPGAESLEVTPPDEA